MSQPQQQQDAVVITMADLTLNIAETRPSPTNTKKKQDTLFGPNIGIVARGPEWTESREKAIDELTPDIVRGWITKSKEPNQSTTTLQALVNLKRPTLRLTPLEPTDSDEHLGGHHDPDALHHHGLEFEYDCDAPKCGITVHVVLAPNHRLADRPSAPGGGQSRVLVFEAVTEGGFGRTLRLEEGATLELGRYEHVQRPARPPPSPPSPSLAETKGESSASAGGSPALPEVEGLGAASAPAPASGDDASDSGANANGRKSKRFTSFHFRKRTAQERAVAGPALAVLDAEAKEDGARGGEREEEGGGEGVRAVIRLAALDAQARPLACANEQTTYLHVVRFGAAPPAGMEDRRPWVVKVVKREATIGAHTFHLHEIYGLSNATSTTNNNSTAANPASPPPPAALPTTYPPQAQPQTQAYDDEPSSECLLCLSAPREVVLLPCRHLVACRECAVNMIEFGAGGQIVTGDAPGDAPGAGAGAGAAEANGGHAEGEGEGGVEGAQAQTQTQTVTPIPHVVPTTTATTRRKRKAKGWFCPVCRQPYTSCLRITTTPPSKDALDRDHDHDHDHDDHDCAEHAGGQGRVVESVPAPAPAAAPPVSRGGLAALVRPGFLRSFTRGAGPGPVGDVERGVVAA